MPVRQAPPPAAAPASRPAPAAAAPAPVAQPQHSMTPAAAAPPSIAQAAPQQPGLFAQSKSKMDA